jgi:hypothetical protein
MSSTTYYGDTARDPQDAAKEYREQQDFDRVPITQEQSSDWFDAGKPLLATFQKKTSVTISGFAARYKCDTYGQVIIIAPDKDQLRKFLSEHDLPFDASKIQSVFMGANNEEGAVA